MSASFSAVMNVRRIGQNYEIFTLKHLRHRHNIIRANIRNNKVPAKDMVTITDNEKLVVLYVGEISTKYLVPYTPEKCFSAGIL